MSSKITLYIHNEEKKPGEPAWPENCWHLYDDFEGVFLEQSGIFATFQAEPGVPCDTGEGLTFLRPEILDKIAELHKMRAFRHQKSAAEEALTDEPKAPESVLDQITREAADLAHRLEGLLKTIGNREYFSNLPPSERQRMISQRKVMYDYLDILGERINALGRGA